MGKKIIDSCQEVSNVTLVCCDGVLHSHKIMIAVVSDFMNDLIKPIPAADNVTIYLPDFRTENVRSVLDQFNFGDINVQLLNEELLSALRCSSNETLDEVFQEESEIEKMKEEANLNSSNLDEFINVGCGSQQVFTSMTATTSGDIDAFNPIINIKSDPDSEEKYIIDEKLKEVPLPPKKVKNANIKVRGPRKMYTIENRQRIQELAEKFLLNDDNTYLTCDDDADDNSLRAKKKKLINEKRQKHISAIEAISRGECGTVSIAAHKYGVNRRTLSKLLVKGKNYQGKGKVPRVFSHEEEKIMTERILAKSDGGKTLTFDIVTEVLNEEVNIKRINHPEKNIGDTFLRNYKYAFVRRCNLDQFIQVNIEAALKDRRIFECEICYKKFTFKNILVSHQKKCHSAFFNC